MVPSHIIELKGIIDPVNEREVRGSGVSGVFCLLKILVMKLTQTFEFDNCEISIIIYEKNSVVTIDIGDSEVDMSLEEFYKFITMLERIKPVKK